jgi:hypothetical protein
VLEKGKNKPAAVTGTACTIPFNVPFAFRKTQNPMLDQTLLQPEAVLHVAFMKITTDMHRNHSQMGWQPSAVSPATEGKKR